MRCLVGIRIFHQFQNSGDSGIAVFFGYSDFKHTGFIYSTAVNLISDIHITEL